MGFVWGHDLSADLWVFCGPSAVPWILRKGLAAGAIFRRFLRCPISRPMSGSPISWRPWGCSGRWLAGTRVGWPSARDFCLRQGLVPSMSMAMTNRCWPAEVIVSDSYARTGSCGLECGTGQVTPMP